MKMIKYLSTMLLFTILSMKVSAQDVVIIADGDFVRGTIQGTDFQTVGIKTEDGAVQQYKAKDIKEFQWNGETFISKTFVTNKNTDYRFFRLIEGGTINLYSMGGSTGKAKKKRSGLRFIPSIGIGIGTGGYRGVGFGGGVTFGGGRNEEEQVQAAERPGLYYIEKPGTGDMLEITPDPDNSDFNTSYIKKTLLEKFADDQDLTARVKGMNGFDFKTIQKLVKAYNSVHQVNDHQ